MKTADIYNNFIVEKITDLSEINCRMLELRDQLSGASVMHIENDDSENVFSLSFKTLPENSHGTAHILEHTVLCGSKKFPVRDPFFSMKKRSLNTFMNAMTGSDFTCYPAASALEIDFYNLLEVYLDAVFHPNIDQLSFLQEGHRLEYNKESKLLENKGVVFNEMKGAMSSPFSIMWKSMMAELLPDTPYSHDSGGDPIDIPKITYEELINFHKNFYHPSRCLFFFYGDIPVKKHLDYIRKEVLHDVKPLPELPKLKRQKRFTKPVKTSVLYPAPIMEDISQQNIISFSWLTCSIFDQLELLALQVLETILMGTDAAPLKRAILSSGLCHQAGSHIENEIQEVPWLLYFQGCRSEDADAIEKTVFETLEKIAQEGFSQRQIEAAIHQHEIQRSEITGDDSPYGLTLFMRAALIKQHGGEADNGLKIHSIFEKLREYIDQSNYFEMLLKKHFLDNPHYVRTVLRPDLNIKQLEDLTECEKLKKIEEKLSKKERSMIIKNAKALEKLQNEEEENIDCLPTVTTADVPEKPTYYKLEEDQFKTLNLYHHETFTNGIVYADMCCKIESLPEEMLSYAKLYTVLLPHLGCGGRSYNENLEYIQENTGGVDLSLSFCTSSDDFNSIAPSISIEGKALERKAQELLELYCDIIQKPDFSETERIKELLLQHHVSLEQSINDSGLKYAVSTSCGALSEASYIGGYWGGINYLRFIRKLINDIDKNLPILQEKMHSLHKELLEGKCFDLILSCDAKAKEEIILSEGFKKILDLGTDKKVSWRTSYQLPDKERASYAISSAVAFTSQAFNTVPYNHPDSPALAVTAYLLNNKTLHRRIREQGGAYGGGASCNSCGGKFYFYSYRDPNITSTLEAFKESLDVAVNKNFSERDLEEAKLEVFQKLDSPVSPGSRAYGSYHHLQEGITLEKMMVFRKRLLDVSADDISRSVKKHIIPHLEKAPVASFASQEIINKEKATISPPLIEREI